MKEWEIAKSAAATNDRTRESERIRIREMNLDPLSFSLSQINFLITNLNKRNFKSSQSELQSILAESSASSSSTAYETERHLFRFLISNIDFNAATQAASSSTTTTASSSTTDANSSKSTSTVNTSSGTSLTSTPSSIGTGSGKDHHQIQLLRDYVCAYLAKPNFATLLCYCIDNPLQYQEVLKKLIDFIFFFYCCCWLNYINYLSLSNIQLI